MHESDHLAEADRHIEGAKERIARQKKVIAELERDGDETDLAIQLLAELEHALRAMAALKPSRMSGHSAEAVKRKTTTRPHTRRGITRIRQKKTPAENFEDGPPITLVVVSGNDSNPVVFHTEFSSASLYYAPPPHL